MVVARRGVPRGDARRHQARELARRHRRARQGRLARRAPPLAAARGARLADPARLAVDPPRARSTTPTAIGIRSGFGSPYLRLGYLKVFMDGTLGSQTALDARRQRRPDHERRPNSPRSCAVAPKRASPSRCTRSATVRTAKRSTRSSRRASSGSPKACGSASSTRSCSRPKTCPLRRARRPCSVQFSHAPSDRDLADRYWAGQDRRRLRIPLAARIGRGRLQRQRRADRGARPARRHPGRRSPHDRRPTRLASRAALTVAPGVPRDVRRSGLAGRRRAQPRHADPRPCADLVVLDRDPWDDLDAQVVATMVAGRWVHNPPPWN